MQNMPLVVLGLSFGNLRHLERRGLASFECRFLEELKEYFPFLVKTAFISFEMFLHEINFARMVIST
jgi:hypothetical protein